MLALWSNDDGISSEWEGIPSKGGGRRLLPPVKGDPLGERDEDEDDDCI